MPTIAIGIGKSPTDTPVATVPLSALSEDGVPPEENDKVSFSVEGTVQSVSGSNATISIDSINGEPISESEETSESPEEEAGEEGQGGGGGATPGQTPVKANGPRSPTGLDPSLAPMGGAAPKSPPAVPGIGAPLRNRLNRAGTNAIRNRLLAGARNRPLL